MEKTKPEAWEKCSTEERIDRLSSYVIPRVDYSHLPVTKEDIYQQTALVYLEAMTNGGERLNFHQMSNHCLNRVRHYLKTLIDEETDCDSGLEPDGYLMLRELTDMVSADFLTRLDQVLIELEKDSYLQVWFDTYRREVGIPIRDLDRINDVADLSKPPIESLWYDARKVLESKIRNHVSGLGWLPESIDFLLSCEILHRLGADSIFSKTFY